MLIQFYCFIINKHYKIINVFNVFKNQGRAFSARP